MSAPQALLFAKGRLKHGQMNRTEAAYARLLESDKAAGRVVCWWFESLKLKIADGACWYTPDFLVLLPDGTLELHEVKGARRIFQDDAKVKCKVAATMYPFPLKVVYPAKGGWDVEEM